ncbi:hypothetical protein B0O99DRAFT_44234 [Bisporella sp. PMI_857]|nr:hypothetical protein B0O99DRAFT_44234 [Bisporella sp. PMI_857]
MTPPIRSLRYPSARPLLDSEHKHMEYFQVVCAGEFSLFFELPAWENIILQGALAEPALHHAALAIGALASGRYHPNIWQTPPAIVFSIRHYSMAIQDLYRRLDGSSQSLELAFLASFFSAISSFSWDSIAGSRCICRLDVPYLRTSTRGTIRHSRFLLRLDRTARLAVYLLDMIYLPVLCFRSLLKSIALWHFGRTAAIDK